jgi:hypothetical protein
MISQLQVISRGYWYPLAEGERVALGNGDILRINVHVPYKGPAQQWTLNGSIGQYRGILGFDPILEGRALLDCPESLHTFIVVEGSVDIEIVVAGMLGIGGISPGTGYSIRVKVEEYDKAVDEIEGVVDIAGTEAPDMSGMVMMMFPLMMLGMVAPLMEGMEE